MAITVDAVYENGVLRLAQSLPFKENEKVRVTVEPRTSSAVIPCQDAQLIEWAAMDPELEFPPTAEKS
jgi:predicted DNA-binding antitoxin AbrB/MazE fold protein